MYLLLLFRFYEHAGEITLSTTLILAKHGGGGRGEAECVGGEAFATMCGQNFVAA